jgi:hypothetical protein
MEKVELDKLTKIVDDFVTQLKKDLLAVEYKPTAGVLPGVWDRMKNWWYNSVLKKGGNDTNNPYVYKNKFGALGHEDDTKKESSRLTLSQYNFIKEQYNKLESDISVLNEDLDAESENLKKLKLWKIIDGWATKFKQEIINQFSGAEAEATPAPKASADGGAASSDAAADTAPMEAPPSGGVGGDAGGGDRTGTGRRRGRGRPPQIRISWSKDGGWGPKSKDGKLPENRINRIRGKVLERLIEKKEDHPDFEKDFDKDFEEAFEKILSHSEEELKSHPSEVSKIEDSNAKWEGFLVRHIAEKMHLILVSRDLGLE